MMLYPQILEKYSSTIVAELNLPRPKSGKFLFRLARFPDRGTATYIDILDYRSRVMLRVSRILSDIRNLNLINDVPKTARVEISSGFISHTEFLIKEFNSINSKSLMPELENTKFGNHYFIFYTDSFDCTVSGISNPHDKAHAELWHRIINRSYGLEHSVPRRHLRTCNLLVS
tara:strand:- start:5992 stop:6510 length:519 start_codon:yes stop_codon:yes gene_type:complete